jgi:hypothetical protein
MRKKVKAVVACAGVLLFAVGCGLTYTIVQPKVSALKYAEGPSGKITINIIDKRTGADTVFIKKESALKSADINLADFKNPMQFLSENLEKELSARGIPVTCLVNSAEKGDITLTVERFDIINRRTSGFSPWEAYHCFRGTVANATGTFPLHAYFFNGKVPVWSMKEVEEPCINMPLSICVKEIASKINRLAIGLKSGDQAVENLAKEIESQIGKSDNGPFWKVFELAATNNPLAMDHLKKYTSSTDNFFKSCVYSAMGILGSQNEFEYLKQSIGKSEECSKFMVLKSIGDIENQEARDFIAQKAKSDNDEGVQYCSQLYAR